MLTGTPGVGGFLWQEYNSLVYSHIILSVVTIGAIGFVLDRLMGAGRGARPERTRWPTSRCVGCREVVTARRRRDARAAAASI